MVKNYNEVLHESAHIDCGSVILRRFSGADAADALEYMSDSDVIKYLGWGNVPKDMQAVKDRIYNTSIISPSTYAIEFKETGKCIGEIGFRLNVSSERAEIYYMLHRGYWGKGIMSVVLSAIIKLCFEGIGLNRVEAGHFVGNEVSGKVMEKCGMIKEGVARGLIKDGDIFRDEVKYGLLRNEWEAFLKA